MTGPQMTRDVTRRVVYATSRRINSVTREMTEGRIRPQYALNLMQAAIDKARSDLAVPTRENTKVDPRDDCPCGRSIPGLQEPTEAWCALHKRTAVLLPETNKEIPRAIQ